MHRAKYVGGGAHSFYPSPGMPPSQHYSVLTSPEALRLTV